MQMKLYLFYSGQAIQCWHEVAETLDPSYQSAQLCLQTTVKQHKKNSPKKLQQFFQFLNNHQIVLNVHLKEG
jgi:hypothetical protein